MNKRITITIGLALMALAVNAQSAHFLDSLRRADSGKGKVTVVESQEIDNLVNGSATTKTKPQVNVVPEAKTPVTTPDSHIASGNTVGNERTSKTNTKVDDNASEYVEPSVDTRRKVIANAYKVTGYRIQVFSGGNSREDRQKAQDAGNRIKNAFPTEPIYVHFYSPSWKCRMGNYRDLGEARKILKQVKAMGYTQACIVKGKISVSY